VQRHFRIGHRSAFRLSRMLRRPCSRFRRCLLSRRRCDQGQWRRIRLRLRRQVVQAEESRGSRFVNMVFGGRLSQTWLALVAAALLPIGLAVLVVTTPWVPGAFVFAILFGMGSGLASIVGGTLPLELFGRDGYGARLGWVTAARQLSSAVAPFALAAAIAKAGIVPTLWLTAVFGTLGIGAFAAIVIIRQRRGNIAMFRASIA
jgi:hypothetical protein